MSGPILYFSEGFASLPRPPLCSRYCTVAMGLLPVPRLCGQCRGGLPAAAGPIWSPEPAAAAQPPGGPADVPRAWEWGFRPIQVHGHRRHSAAGGAGGGQRDLGRLAPFSLPFQRRQCPRCIQIPRPFLLLTSAHINKLPHRASVEQSVP